MGAFDDAVSALQAGLVTGPSGSITPAKLRNLVVDCLLTLKSDAASDLAATTTGKGASLVGIEDADEIITAENVEDALAELAAELNSPLLRDLITADLDQGDVLYFDGDNLVALPAGTDGEYLKTQGPGANPTWGEPVADLTAEIDALEATRVSVAAEQPFTDDQKIQARSNIYAAPFDAMAYHGLQVNGFHQISQQNGDTAGTTSGYCPADQQQIGINGSFACTVQRVAAPFTGRLDIPRAVKIEVTTGAALGSGDYAVLQEDIEGERLRGRLLWGSSLAVPLRIGRVLRSNISGRGYVAIRNAAYNRTYVKAFDIVADTDTYVEVTIPGDTSGTWAVDNTAGIRVTWCFGTGSIYQTTAETWAAGGFLGASDCTNFMATTGNTVWLGPQVILPGYELPTFAEIMKCQRHYDDELRACQRYWATTTASIRMYASAGGQTSENTIYWPQEMRVAPTTGGPSGGSVSNGSDALYNATTHSVRHSLTAAAAGDSYVINRVVTANARM